MWAQSKSAALTLAVVLGFLHLALPAEAQQVGANETLQFTQADEGNTAPAGHPSARFDLSARRIEVRATIGPNAPPLEFATASRISNLFGVSDPMGSGTELEAFISYLVNWRGSISNATVSGRSRVVITLILRSLTSGAVQSTRLLDQTSTSSGCTTPAGCTASPIPLSDTVEGSFAVKVVRGENYRIDLHISCTAEFGLGGVATCDFFSLAAQDFNGAGWDRLAISVGADLGEALAMLEAKADALEAKEDLNTLAVAALEAKSDRIEAKIDAVEAKLDLLEIKSDELQTSVDEVLKREIEESLGDCRELTTLYLPSAYGGRLELVRDLVADAIGNSDSAGLETRKARRLFAKGEEEFADNEYTDAYDKFCAAYRRLVKDSDSDSDSDSDK